jgi:hypothetical protein
MMRKKLQKVTILVMVFVVVGTNMVSSQDWKMHTIDNSSSGADGIKMGDVNRDGYLDLAVGWEEGGITKLYLHPGKSHVRKIWPSVIVGETRSVEDAVFLDMNGDGHQDIVSCTEYHSEKIWVQLSPKRKFLNPKKWKQVLLPPSDGVTMWMYAEPLQIDGKNGVDLVAAGKNNNSVLGWFEAPKKRKDLLGWAWHQISLMGWVMSIVNRDMDGDGDIDIIVTDRRSDLSGCRWLENPGIGERQKNEWKNHFIGAKGMEVMFMSVADMDQDGVEEIILTERTDQTIRIYKRKDKLGLEWHEKIIPVPESTGNCKSVEAGDINGDGIYDLVLSTNTGNEEKVGLTWMDGSNIDKKHGLIFQPISGIHRAKYDKVLLVDLDVDGDLDVLICEENHGENSQGLGVVWYENEL